MEPKPSISELCSRYHNEDPHTEHVTSLAINIYNRIYKKFDIPKKHKPLLKAACRLHDLGYFIDPSNHAIASTEIIIQEGITGFSSDQTLLIAGIILLHQKGYKKFLNNPLIKKSKNSDILLKFAAILRISDGLDHGHIQNAQITSSRFREDAFYLTINSTGYDGNIPWARSKSDLWHQVFPVPIKLSYITLKDNISRYQGVIRSNDSVLETARRLFYIHYRTIVDNLPSTLVAEESEPLHDLRVASRRFRAVFHNFRNHLVETSAVDLANRLSDLSSKLGPIRDSDIWVEILKNQKTATYIKNPEAWQSFIKQAEELRNKNISRLREILQSKVFSSLLYDIVFFLRVEIRDSCKTAPQTPLKPYAAKKLRNVFKRIQTTSKINNKTSAKTLHVLRKQCRKERYRLEFFAPVFDPYISKLAIQFKELTDALGYIHDLDVGLARLKCNSGTTGKNIFSYLTEERDAAFMNFLSIWNNLQKKKTQKKLEKLMKEL
ncbi:MAG: CHAD domain-containing protein [Candidatus Theseobacter exili]|nr:CHAD domain-containing protein [Candidatus Theseobacter exili]